MKLVVTTPLAIVAEVEDVTSLRAEDETGAFGILPGHADFVTALAISVLTWRDGRGAVHHAAVRGGMLEVRGGRAVTVATREAVCDDDLARLETQVLVRLKREAMEDQAAHTDSQRLYLEAIRRIYRLLRPGRSAAIPNAGGGGEAEGLSQ